MIEIKVTYSDDDYILTRFSGTLAEAQQYYIGKIFNTGSVRDHLVKCVNVELIKEAQQ